MKNKITKKLEPTGDVCFKFTEEELESLNIKEGDKFSVKIDDKGVLLEKYSTIELDLSEFDRSNLEFLIEESIEKDISVNDVIANILDRFISEHEEFKSRQDNGNSELSN
jgi:hypothetical protein